MDGFLQSLQRCRSLSCVSTPNWRASPCAALDTGNHHAARMSVDLTDAHDVWRLYRLLGVELLNDRTDIGHVAEPVRQRSGGTARYGRKQPVTGKARFPTD